MYDHDISNREKAILKDYSDLEIEQEEWDLNYCYEEGRDQYLKECAEINITFDDYNYFCYHYSTELFLVFSFHYRILMFIAPNTDLPPDKLI